LIKPYSTLFRWFTRISYKVSPFVFNFWETEYILFLYFAILGSFCSKKWSWIFKALLLSWEAAGEVVAHEKSHEAQASMGGAAHWPGRATRDGLSLERRLVSVFFMDAFVSRKKGCPIFPIFFLGGSGGETLLPHPEGLICCCRL
jgi:hypothetical protein